MGLLSFGGSTSRTDSNSFSFDRSQSGSQAGGFGRAASQDSIAFEDVFARLFGGAEGAAGGLDPSILTNAANTLFSGGTGFLGSIGGDAGTQYLQNRLTGPNQQLEDQIGQLEADVGRFFSEQVNPEITSQAVSGGALGGGRQGVAQAGAARAAGETFASGAAALRAGDLASRDQAAGELAVNTVQGANVGLQGLGGLAGIARLNFGANLAPYERLAGILGGPTTLNQSASSSGDFARSFSDSFGFGRASSTSRSRSLDLGFG